MKYRTIVADPPRSLRVGLLGRRKPVDGGDARMNSSIRGLRVSPSYLRPTSLALESRDPFAGFRQENRRSNHTPRLGAPDSRYERANPAASSAAPDRRPTPVVPWRSVQEAI